MLSRHLQDTALRYFLEVVHSGTVSEAALRLNVSASAVSRQIASLEDVLGVPLFDRRPRGMQPSAAGELLAAYARRGALEADRVVSEIQELQGLKRGQVRLASSPGFSIEFLPRVIAGFRQRFPGIQFHVATSSPADVTAAVLNGDADLGLKYSRSAEDGIEVAWRQPSPVIAIMRPDHPLARFSNVTLAQMHGYDMALPEADNTVRQLFDIGCSNRRLVFKPVLVSNRFETLLHYVLHAGVLSISGEVTVRDRVRRGELCAAALRERHMDGRAIEVQTLIGRTLPASVRAFLAHLTQELERPR